MKTKNRNKETRKSLEKGISDSARPLTDLTKRKRNTFYTNDKIYHLLCLPFTYINAYAKISKNVGALTKGFKDTNIMQLYSKKDASKIANKFKNNIYKWSPVRQTWIPKPGKNKLQPIDTPTQEDRIVQEAIPCILESIFEPEFVEFEEKNNYLSTNYGFRNNKSTWTAIEQLKNKGQGCNFALEGDIVSAYNNVDHEILLSILSRRINDRRFLKVIKSMPKSGIMDREKFENTLTGTPQSGIVSPLLFNIYMFELDKFIYNTIILPILETNKTKKRKGNPTSKNIKYQIGKLKEQKTKKNQKEITKKLKRLITIRSKIPSYIPQTIPRSIIYARYADDWVLLVNETMKEITHFKELISNFIDSNLKTQLDPDKTQITQTTKGFNFLGFTYTMSSIKSMKSSKVIVKNKYSTNRIIKRTTSRMTIITSDKSRILKNLTLREYCDKNHKPISSPKYIPLLDFEIVLHYKQVMNGIFNYYRFVPNLSIINYTFYILKYSCAKTIARKKKNQFQKYSPN